MDEHPGAEDSSFDSVEHSYDALKRKYGRNQREIRRLRKTVSFQLGLHLTTAVRRPWRFFALPITLPLVALKLGMQRLGKRPIEQMALEDFDNHVLHFKISKFHSLSLYMTLRIKGIKR